MKVYIVKQNSEKGPVETKFQAKSIAIVDGNLVVHKGSPVPFAIFASGTWLEIVEEENVD